MKKFLLSLLTLLSLAVTFYGIWLIYHPLAYICIGIYFIFVAALTNVPKGK